MTSFLDELAARRRLGMKPGLDAIHAVCAALGNPHQQFRSIHVAGTNGKGAVCAILDAYLLACGLRCGRYTSPHLLRLNERFFLDGAPLDDQRLASAAARVKEIIDQKKAPDDLTFFEALTAVAFIVYADASPDFTILETGLGGRLDATNISLSSVSIITHLGLDHCDWLGDTLEKIAFEKAGIIKQNVPIVLGANEPDVVSVIRARAKELNAPFIYAPDVVDEKEIPKSFSLEGSFNRENAQTALAALQILSRMDHRISLTSDAREKGFSRVTWPGRFHRAGRYVIDGAHNPPAARALVRALDEKYGSQKFTLIAGFCGDKDVAETLRILAPKVSSAFAVRTTNSRSLDPANLAMKMREAGLRAMSCDSLADAMRASEQNDGLILICGSLFLAGEALVACHAYPWDSSRLDPSELLTHSSAPRA